MEKKYIYIYLHGNLMEMDETHLTSGVFWGAMPSKVISASLLAAQHSFMEVQVSNWGLQRSETWEPLNRW